MARYGAIHTMRSLIITIIKLYLSHYFYCYIYKTIWFRRRVDKEFLNPLGVPPRGKVMGFIFLVLL